MIDRASLAERAARRADAARLFAKSDFWKFVPWASPDLEPPRHLGPIVSHLLRAREERVRVVTSTPPQHGKTTTIVHALVWMLLKWPALRIAYATFSQERTESVSLGARRLARSVGVDLDQDRQNLADWRTRWGGMFYATSVGGPMTGEGFQIVVVDDPFKGRKEAESAAIRQGTYEWFNSVAFTRQPPGGTSYIVNATRWHPADLSGRLIAQGWESVNCRAIEGDGDAERSLWPKAKTVEELRAIEAQIGPYEFASLYQGEPRAKGATVFGAPTYYETLPDARGVQYFLGGDFAYTANTWSDFSVIVVLAWFGERVPKGLPHEGEPILYVVHVERHRMSADEFRARGAPVQARYPGQAHAFVSGVEKGVIDLMKAPGGQTLRFAPINASTDKFIRAQAVAAAWNAGRVRVPRQAAWLAAFLDELGAFTGVKDPHDDQVDALSGAYVPFAVHAVPRGIGMLPPG